MQADGTPLDLSAVALFPLPNVVLLPRAVLPLHIFEERYKQMTADVLRGSRQIAMALLRPGWEKSYYDRPEIEPVVCVGTILSHERLPDGKYNFLLQGHTRAKVISEHPRAGLPYREVKLEPIAQPVFDEQELVPLRQRLEHIFTSDAFADVGLVHQFRKILGSSFSTSDIADLIAFSFFEDTGLKQSLLAEPDPRKRIERTISELQAMRPVSSSSISPPSLN